MEPTSESSTITYRTSVYQVPRRVLIRTFWRRTMFSRRTILALGVWALMGVGLLFLPNELRFGGVAFIFLVLLAPLNIYQLSAKTVDAEPQLTDPRTLEFNRAALVLTGPDWKTEVAWTRYRGYSEDEVYFYLHLRFSELVLLIPKSALTAEQQAGFRECAGRRAA